MIARRIALAVTVPVAGVALIPAKPNSPSGLNVILSLPAGLIGAVQRPPPRVHSLEVSIFVERLRTRVHLCGICHVTSESAQAAREATRRLSVTGLDAVALECDAQTLGFICTAQEAVSGLSQEHVKSEGTHRVREALFASPQLHALARKAGVTLATAAQVPVPPMIVAHLEQDGVVWSAEMSEASAGAKEANARVVCLSSPPRPHSLSLLGTIGIWLRARALAPGLDERSCDIVPIEAVKCAMLELVPAFYNTHVVEPDRYMAQRVYELCEDLAAESTTAGAPRTHCVVVVVGASHVAGMAALLQGYDFE